MRNLFLFLYRYYAFFLFLILQVLCLLLILENNSYHRAAFLNLTDEMVGKTTAMYDNITKYLKLGDENRKLAEENARLRNLFPSVSYSDTSKVYSHKDSGRKQFYTFIPAQVIQTSTNQPNNYLIIDKGSAQGIEPRMAVVGPEGVVGIVKSTSKNFASLFSLLHSQVTVSARVRRDGSRGTIRWDGKSPDYVNIDDITRQETLHKGDTIFTSGVSRIFPDNIPIGYVEEFNLIEPGLFYSVRVKLATNFRKVDHVYVVNNLLHEEMDSLLNKTNAQ